ISVHWHCFPVSPKLVLDAPRKSADLKPLKEVNPDLPHVMNTTFLWPFIYLFFLLSHFFSHCELFFPHNIVRHIYGKSTTTELKVDKL
uniref:Uncharacterized protein n=1 Tax=Stegastes partitus TaxID=144197 RepID=A0A3B5A7I1_9TELE